MPVNGFNVLADRCISLYLLCVEAMKHIEIVLLELKLQLTTIERHRCVRCM